MKKSFYITLSLALAFIIGAVFTSMTINKYKMENKNIKLGIFSNSLNVKDLTISKEFYEKLGFTQMGGSMEANYLIMKNGKSIIGLFQGMFEGNIMTFNQGWDENAQNVKGFDDIRTIQKVISDKGIQLENKIDEKTAGPASIMFTDPDGNMILIDQHR